jgi:glycosyltransferase involved in cell wall biosynthesis
MRVLISAYACEPDAGSEPGVGWVWAVAAADSNDVTVMTRRNNGPAIERALASAPGLSITPVYVDLPPWASWWKRGGRGLRLYYFLWQVLAWRRGRALHRERPFDVGHHLTFAMDSMPAGVAWIPGLPTVWGPVGGVSRTPRVLYRWLGTRGLVKEVARDLASLPMRRLFGDATARRAQVTVAQNDDVARRFRRSARRIVVEPNVAVETIEHRATPEHTGDRRRAVFAGRLLPLKGVRLAIAALAQAPDWELTIYGSGPERGACEAAADAHGVADRVTFAGQQPRAEVLSAIAEADAMLFPSFHDAAGWAVAEAVMAGTRVVALDLSGVSVVLRRTKGGTAVVPTADVARLLARALDAGTVGDVRTGPVDRRRLPALLEDWYHAAAAGADGASAPSAQGQASG